MFRKPKKHEWLPSKMVYDVIKSINAAPGPKRGIRATELVGMHDEVRSETQYLIFDPEQKTDEEEPTERKGEEETEPRDTYNIYYGHSGALYYDGSPSTKFQSAFHGALEAQFSASAPVIQIVKGLQAVFSDWIWAGNKEKLSNPSPRLTHPTHKALSSEANLEKLAAATTAAYEGTVGTFKQFIKKISET
jgi:hypothetical protein